MVGFLLSLLHNLFHPTLLAPSGALPPRLQGLEKIAVSESHMSYLRSHPGNVGKRRIWGVSHPDLERRRRPAFPKCLTSLQLWAGVRSLGYYSAGTPCLEQ